LIADRGEARADREGAERVEVRLDRLESAFLQFSDALLTTLWAKGVPKLYRQQRGLLLPP